jgi:C-terminal processing protease CtpA/Prc
LSIQPRATGDVKTVTLNWNLTAPESKASPAMPVGLSDMCSEKSRIQPPPSAQLISGVPFTAFSFDSPKGRIGFIRIPHYYPQNEHGEEVAEERFKQYQKVIEEFERTTKGLIIDQDFNCGGSVVFVNKMFSLFYDRPFQPASFAFRASADQVSGLRRQLNKFSPNDDGYPEFKDVVDEIERTLNQGAEMTKPLPMRGFMEVKLDMPGGNQIQPNPIRYTKPIVLLINEMSGSGGDLLPALMKDFGRAKLLGTRTMGAGGHLWDDPPLQLKHSGGEVSLTRSLIYRPNGQPIENYGVEPHKPYPISMDDFLNGYSHYLQAAVDLL